MRFWRTSQQKKWKKIIKQGFEELYTQRLIEENIVKQKLSRLRPHRLRLSWLKPHRLTSHRRGSIGSLGLKLGVGGRGTKEII